MGELEELVREVEGSRTGLRQSASEHDEQLQRLREEVEHTRLLYQQAQDEVGGGRGSFIGLPLVQYSVHVL